MIDALFTMFRAELIAIAISGYICIKAAQLHSTRESLRTFTAFAFAVFLFDVVCLVSVFADCRIIHLSQLASFLLNLAYMAIIGVGLYRWLVFIEVLIGSTWWRSFRNRLLCMAPLAVFLLLSAASWWTGWIFYTDESGVYHRGSMWYLQFAFCYSYILIMLFRTLMYLRSDQAVDKYNRALTINALVILAGCVLQIVYNNSYIALSATVGLLISYVEVVAPGESDLRKQEELSDLLEETRKQKEQLQEALDNFKQADYDRRTDFLTGLHSRQDMFELLQESLSGKSKQITAMFMMDVDSFKMFNDNFGHLRGDDCLKRLGAAFTEYGKTHDMMFYRYGGEEMLGVYFGPVDQARTRAEELVQLVRDQRIERDDVPGGIVTVSLGYTVNNSRYEKMVDRADTAMYTAKEQGKDRFICYEELKG